MTREEEIEYKAGVLSDFAIAHGEPWEEYYKGFKDGAKWADKTMIEKACKWLGNFYQHKLGYRPFEEVVEDFKQAMEE